MDPLSVEESLSAGAAMLEGVQEIRVKVSRWESRRLWWRAGTRAPGLVLHIEGYSTPTQTYRTRDLDSARAMVLDYLEVIGEPVPPDVAICWIETGA
ncbi:hypothetical protein LQ424_30970 [Rhodococcus qingshengii]|uniref:hypothetical protein n=1 Tax=Rhodococcus qingshengii TaxID=334542 RepID=UPI001E546AEB|nr:hypothetical protein [Rhodococcus qingshengii]MCD2136250.1 hypothetical protein [Rhodococcus qingshengii]